MNKKTKQIIEAFNLLRQEVKSGKIQANIIREECQVDIYDYLPHEDGTTRFTVGFNIEISEKEKAIRAENYKQALKIIKEDNKISRPMLQRKLLIGFFEATRIMDVLEMKKVIGPSRGAKLREILINK